MGGWLRGPCAACQHGQNLDRTGLVSGGSIYPFIWNILLAARDEVYGGTMTTWGIAEGPEVSRST